MHEVSSCAAICASEVLNICYLTDEDIASINHLIYWANEHIKLTTATQELLPSSVKHEFLDFLAIKHFAKNKKGLISWLLVFYIFLTLFWDHQNGSQDQILTWEEWRRHISMLLLSHINQKLTTATFWYLLHTHKISIFYLYHYLELLLMPDCKNFSCM